MSFATRVVPVDGDGTRTYDFQCACGFTSSGWVSERLAVTRGVEHVAEHDSGEPAPELGQFREAHSLTAPAVVGFDDEDGGSS